MKTETNQKKKKYSNQCVIYITDDEKNLIEKYKIKYLYTISQVFRLGLRELRKLEQLKEAHQSSQ